MFYILAFILIVLWFIGFAASFSMGGYIYVLPAIAFVFFLLRLFRGPDAWELGAR